MATDDGFVSIPIRQRCVHCRTNEVLFYHEQPETEYCAPCLAELVRNAAALLRAALEIDYAARLAALKKVLPVTH